MKQFTLKKLLLGVACIAIFLTLAINVKFNIHYEPPEWVKVEIGWQDSPKVGFWYWDHPAPDEPPTWGVGYVPC